MGFQNGVFVPMAQTAKLYTPTGHLGIIKNWCPYPSTIRWDVCVCVRATEEEKNQIIKQEIRLKTLGHRLPQSADEMERVLHTLSIDPSIHSPLLATGG